MAARPHRRRRAAPKRRLRRWLRRQDRFTRGLAIAVAALSILVIGLIAPRLREGSREATVDRGTPHVDRDSTARVSRPPTARVAAGRRLPGPAVVSKAPTAGPRPVPAIAERAAGFRAAILIDDLGQSFSHFEQLVALEIPLTIAVIPGLPATARTVKEATRGGVEMLLHQPMEPHEAGGKNPGEGVLLTSMSGPELRSLVRANLEAVPGAVGVNNHMGSRFTENTAGLEALMAEIRAHDLFWLDSRTTAATRTMAVAHTAGVPALKRDIFLDAELNADAIRRQVRKLLELARAHGTAIGIGHPHPETIAVLRELRGELLASGVALVPVSKLVRGNPQTGTGTALAAAQPRWPQLPPSGKRERHD